MNVANFTNTHAAYNQTIWKYTNTQKTDKRGCRQMLRDYNLIKRRTVLYRVLVGIYLKVTTIWVHTSWEMLTMNTKVLVLQQDSLFKHADIARTRCKVTRWLRNVLLCQWCKYETSRFINGGFHRSGARETWMWNEMLVSFVPVTTHEDISQHDRRVALRIKVCYSLRREPVALLQVVCFTFNLLRGACKIIEMCLIEITSIRCVFQACTVKNVH